jgi:hypothetical protein
MSARSIRSKGSLFLIVWIPLLPVSRAQIFLIFQALSHRFSTPSASEGIIRSACLHRSLKPSQRWAGTPWVEYPIPSLTLGVLNS